MPLVKGSSEDTEQNPAGRIRHTHRLLLSAALIMSVFLIASSLVTTLLISSVDFRPASDTSPAGPANGRALAYLAHRYLGDGFGTLYDLSTILILWFAGASAMAGLLNIVPRYLPRYGMAPEWAVLPARWCSSIRNRVCDYYHLPSERGRAGRRICHGRARLDEFCFHSGDAFGMAQTNRIEVASRSFGVITAIFLYTTGTNIVERPDGVKIAAFFIGMIIITSLLSRVWGRPNCVWEKLRWTPRRSVSLTNRWQGHHDGIVRIIANDPDAGDMAEG